ncbi:MAG: diaminopimelate decarboxylase, partial [Methanosarcinales archaeon]
PYIATGLHNNKFGMALSDLPILRELLKKNSDVLVFRGISLHLGSQMQELNGFREALTLLKPVYLELQKDFSSVDTFDIGGGLGVFYENQSLVDEEELLASYALIVREELKGMNAKLQTEPGRWLLAHAGVLLTQVQYLKQTVSKNFVIVDTGMHHLLRPTLYQAHHAIWPVHQSDNVPDKLFDVVGPICESGDFIAQGRSLPALKELDFLVVADVGAYGFSMRSDYNLQDAPQEIFL